MISKSSTYDLSQTVSGLLTGNTPFGVESPSISEAVHPAFKRWMSRSTPCSLGEDGTRTMPNKPTSIFISALFAFLLAVGTGAAFDQAQAAQCGGLNQQACPVLKRGPVCKAWLTKVGRFCRPCGGLNQRACPVLKGGKTCKPGLRRRRGICVRKQASKMEQLKNRLFRDAQREVRRLKPIIDDLVRYAKGTRRDLIRAIKTRRPDDIRKVIERHPRIRLTYSALKRLGFNTMTVGLESSGSAGIGYARETGASLDVHRRARARLYAANTGIAGGIANVGNDIAISAFTARNHDIGGPALWGALGSFNVATGVGLTIWYEKKTLRAVGFSVNIGVGNIGAGGAILHTKTRVY